MTTSRRLVVTLLLMAAPAFAQKAESLVTVPFVGCPADGQQGPIDPPTGKPLQVAIPLSAAAQLAWYQFNLDKSTPELGTLAPRGWHCFGTYGSNGSAIYVAPEPLNADKLILGRNWDGFTGPVVQLSINFGDTSGRFEVARVVARIFPAHRAYAQKVMADRFNYPGNIHFGPFSADKLIYKSPELVEFITPAHSEGVGTMAQLQPAGLPIHGLASVDPAAGMNLTQLNLRLPSNLQSLAPILAAAEEQNLLHKKQ